MNAATLISDLLYAGALVGPPWEKRQNAYLLRENCPGGMSVFYEPHCDYNLDSVQKHVKGAVDVVVAPIMNQNLISYPLVRFLGQGLGCQYNEFLEVMMT